MKHFKPAVSHLGQPAVTVLTMRDLLLSRRESLEGQIRERHRQARECGTVADVKMLSATLRQIRRQLASLDNRHERNLSCSTT
jgi:hypothetical protein